MAIHSDHNLYPGVNPHLNSYLQQPCGGWESFHGKLIGEIVLELDRTLSPNYYAVNEKSLQINEEYMYAAVIYEVTAGQTRGTPVAWIEVLSPATKHSSNSQQYLGKRQETLTSQINLIEIDLLHEQPPILPSLPSYPQQQTYAEPYTVLTTIPPVAGERVRLHVFKVLQSIPNVALPLGHSEVIVLDLQRVYNHVLATSRLFILLIDYSQPPVNFDRYTPADQALIRQRIAEIASGQ